MLLSSEMSKHSARTNALNTRYTKMLVKTEISKASRDLTVISKSPQVGHKVIKKWA